MLSLNAGGRDVVLPQLNVPGFVDSPWETLPFLRSGWGWIGWEQEGKLWFVYKIKK